MSRLSGMSYEQAWDPANAAANVSNGTEFTVPGARPGDFAFATLSSIGAADCDNMIMGAFVTADDQVTVTIHADGTGSNLSSGTLRIKVVPFDAI